MIDLTKGLPNAIVGDDGEPIYLNTDYRFWIKFDYDIKQDDTERDISYLFIDNVPVITQNIWEQLKMFLYNPSATPNSDSSSEDKILDYILDGDYIFSALYSTYGIDILETDMHWHKFQALCNNIIGESTLWGYAKSVRGYRKTSKKDTIDAQYSRAKKAWSFRKELSEEEQRQIKEFEDYFDGA